MILKIFMTDRMTWLMSFGVFIMPCFIIFVLLLQVIFVDGNGILHPRGNHRFSMCYTTNSFIPIRNKSVCQHAYVYNSTLWHSFSILCITLFKFHIPSRIWTGKPSWSNHWHVYNRSWKNLIPSWWIGKKLWTCTAGKIFSQCAYALDIILNIK